MADFVNKTIQRMSQCKSLKIRKFYSKVLLVTSGVDIGLHSVIGKGVVFKHGGLGTVIHDTTVIEDNVMIMPDVLVGRSDVWLPRNESRFEKVIIKSGAVLGVGCKVLCKEGVLVVGNNTIIGANSVLTQSTGDNEIWAGIPAKKIGMRQSSEE